MDHKLGKDPTPGGRVSSRAQTLDQPTNTAPVDPKYANSAPGPDQMEDGAAFFGYKRENAYPSSPGKQH